MDLLKNKRLWIEDKKKDLPEEFLKQGLGSLFISVNDVYERLNKGKKNIVKLKKFDDLYKENGNDVVMIDIRNIGYDAQLDNIAYAKRINEELCVVVEDVLIEDYQMYLYNMYNIDGVIFDVEYVNEKRLKNIIYLAEVMGIELIYSINSKEDLDKIADYINQLRIVALKNNDIIDKIPKNVFILDTSNVMLNVKVADILITLKERNNE